MDNCKVVILGYPGRNTPSEIVKLIKLNYIKSGFDPKTFFAVGKSDPSYDPTFFLERAAEMQGFIRREVESGSPSLGFIDERDRLNVVFEDISDAISLVGSEKLKMLSLFGGVRVMIFLMSEKSKPISETFDMFCKIFPRASIEYIKDLHTQDEREAHAQATAVGAATTSSTKEKYQIQQVKEEAASEFLGPRIAHKVVNSELTAPQVQKSDIQNAAVVVTGSGKLLSLSSIPNESVVAALPLIKPSHTEIKDSEAVEVSKTKLSGKEDLKTIDSDTVLTDYRIRPLDTPSSEGGLKHIQSEKITFSDLKNVIPSSLGNSVNDAKSNTTTASTLAGPSGSKYNFHTVLSDKLAKMINMLSHQRESRKAALETSPSSLKKSIPKIDEKIKQQGPGVTISKVDASVIPPQSASSASSSTTALAPQVGKPVQPPQVGKPIPSEMSRELHEDERVVAGAQKFGLAPFDRHVVHVEDDTTFDVVCALLYKLGIPHAIVTRKDSLETQYKMIELVFNKGIKHSEKYVKVLRRFRRSLQRVSMEKKAAQKALNKEVKKLQKKIEKEGGSGGKKKIESEMSLILKETTTTTSREESSSSSSSSSSDSDSDDEENYHHHQKQQPWVLITNTVLQYRPKFVSHLHIVDGGNIDKINAIVDAIYLKESCTHTPNLNIVHHIASLPHKNPTQSTGFKELLMEATAKEAEKEEADDKSSSSSSSSSSSEELSTCCPSDSEATCCGEDGPSYEYEGSISLKDKFATEIKERRVTSIKTNEKMNPRTGIKIQTLMETTSTYPSKFEDFKTLNVSKKFHMIPCYELFDYYQGVHNFVMSELDDVPSSKEKRLKQYYAEYRQLSRSKTYDHENDPFYHYYDRLRNAKLLDDFKTHYDVWNKFIHSSRLVRSKDIVY